jgi:hypothetical protein
MRRRTPPSRELADTPPRDRWFLEMVKPIMALTSLEGLEGDFHAGRVRRSRE